MALTSNVDAKLLNDVAQFLGVTLSSEMLSLHADEERESLLRRLAGYLSDAPAPYLDMNGTGKATESPTNPSSQTPPVDQGLYEEFPEHPANNFQQQDIQVYERYGNMPISELRQAANKYGPLLRKERFVIIDKYRRYWAGLTGHMLLLYAGERDAKPNIMFDLMGFEARLAVNHSIKDQKKKDVCFEIVCPGKKTQQFFARTPKDMDQWVIAICQASGRDLTPVNNLLEPTRSEQPTVPISNTISRRLPTPQTIDDPNTMYDNVDSPRNVDSEDVEEDEMYSSIRDQPLQEKNEIVVPARRPVPKLPPANPSQEEDLYDDAAALIQQNNLYYNVLDNSSQVMNHIPPMEFHQFHLPDMEEEAEYADIGLAEERETEKPVMWRDGQGTGTRIQNLIHKMESTLKRYPHQPGMILPVSASPADELYEPVMSPDEEVAEEVQLNVKPRLPPRTRS